MQVPNEEPKPKITATPDALLQERERLLIRRHIYKVIRVRPNGKITLRLEE